MSYEEFTPIGRYFDFSPASNAIPSIYWDAFSPEQRYHAICKALTKIAAYVDQLGVTLDDLGGFYDELADGMENYELLELAVINNVKHGNVSVGSSTGTGSELTFTGYVTFDDSFQSTNIPDVVLTVKTTSTSDIHAYVTSIGPSGFNYTVKTSNDDTATITLGFVAVADFTYTIIG